MSSTRREFLAATAAAAAALTVARLPIAWGEPAETPLSDIPELKTPESTKRGDMLYRPLGKTGEKVSLIGLGGYHLGNPWSAEESTRLLRKAVDAGITFMDNCWDYHGGDSEVRMGNALKDGYRQKVFLMTKIDGQTRAAAESQLNDCLKRLQTDTIDLLQIHEVIRPTDPERAFAPGGSVEFLLEAKKAGKIRYIGFTGHKDPSIHMKMLETAKKNGFHFDACQMPLNVMDAHFRSFSREVVPELVKEGTGVLAMKTMAMGAILRTRTVTATECLHYAMNLPSSTVITGIDSDQLLDQALQAVKTFKPFTAEELATLLGKTKEAAAKGAHEQFKTGTMFDGTAHNPKWLG